MDLKSRARARLLNGVVMRAIRRVGVSAGRLTHVVAQGEGPGTGYEGKAVPTSRAAHDPCMAKRNVVTILWFLTGWGVGNVLFSPMSILALAPALVLAALVYSDPMHLLWSRSDRQTRRVRPINEVADELDRRAAQHAPTEVDRLSS